MRKEKIYASLLFFPVGSHREEYRKEQETKNDCQRNRRGNLDVGHVQFQSDETAQCVDVLIHRQ